MIARLTAQQRRRQPAQLRASGRQEDPPPRFKSVSSILHLASLPRQLDFLRHSPQQRTRLKPELTHEVVSTDRRPRHAFAPAGPPLHQSLRTRPSFADEVAVVSDTGGQAQDDRLGFPGSRLPKERDDRTPGQRRGRPGRPDSHPLVSGLPCEYGHRGG